MFHLGKSSNGLETVKRAVRKSPLGALKYVRGKNNGWSSVDVTNCNIDPARKRGPQGPSDVSLGMCNLFA